MKKLLITIPCHNEGIVLEGTVTAVHRYAAKKLGKYDWTILLVDNASTDATLAIAQKLSREHPNIKAMEYPVKGKGGAIQAAWMGHPGFDVYSFMDADLATDLKDFRRLVDAAAGPYDIATGSRYLPSSRVRRTRLRKVASRVFNVIAHALLPVHFHDTQCGFKAMKSRVVDTIFPLTKDTGWFWDTEVMVWAGVRGKKILELPISWREVRTRERKSTVAPFREAFIQIRNLLRLRRQLQ